LMGAGPYEGDVTPDHAWNVLSSSARAALVDVRTAAEWAFVGAPDLSGAPGTFLRVEWQRYPDMARNPDFVADVGSALAEAGVGRDDPVFFLCRSGVRSAAAAAALTAAGYRNCYNISGGFEGPLDEERHRGRVEGWKAEGLPWAQP
jgi:rhodanese-related sulfurtransferase